MTSVLGSRDEVWEHDGHFGERVKRLRSLVPLSRKNLAEKCGVTPETVSRWERYNKVPRDDVVLGALAGALGTTTGFLLLGEEDDD
jgi:transcriptional regulator with XRE-family HTH domain